MRRNRKRHGIFFTVLIFLLLLAAAFAPAAVLRWRTHRIVESVTVYSDEKPLVLSFSFPNPDVIPGKTDAAGSCDVLLRAAAISKSDLVMIMVDTADDTAKTEEDEERRKQILYTAKEELEKLSGFGALPWLPFSDALAGSVREIVYIDPNAQKNADRYAPDAAIDVFEVLLIYSDFNVGVLLDTELSAVYSLGIQSKNGRFLYPSEISAERFLDYLSSFTDIPNNGRFEADGFYGETEIALSVREKTPSTKSSDWD